MADLKGHATAMIEAFNNSDFDTYMNLAGDATYHEPATGRSMSGDDLRAGLIGWRTAFPDVTGTVTSTIESGDRVVQEVTWKGTHTGPLATPTGEIPPTGKSQTTLAVIVSDYEGEHLKDSRHYFDLMSLMTQLGVV